MNTMVLNMALRLIQSLTGARLWLILESLVSQADALDLPGESKRTWVRNQLAQMPEPLRTVVSGVAGYLMNLALEALVAKLKSGTKTA